MSDEGHDLGYCDECGVFTDGYMRDGVLYCGIHVPPKPIVLTEEDFDLIYDKADVSGPWHQWPDLAAEEPFDTLISGTIRAFYWLRSKVCETETNNSDQARGERIERRQRHPGHQAGLRGEPDGSRARAGDGDWAGRGHPRQ